MQFYSTNNPQLRVSFKEAIFKGLPEDKGLFMPVEIPVLADEFIKNLSQYSFQELSYIVAHNLLEGSIPEKELETIIQKAVNFPAPVIFLEERLAVLELFHGPSLAFKDFGARFMAETMSYLNRGEDDDLTILVATSGDTGGAVAMGFLNTPGIKVVILYPSGKVSPLQEKQLTSLGHNITAIEVKGTFDDCQALVKKAFLDTDINTKMRLSSANSINIARLIPQSFYYFEAYKQVYSKGKPVAFSVPSGNFGNLTAGLLAQKMGLPIAHFIAATNLNDVVPVYLRTGEYTPRPSVRTLSNAMDVGAPSNFARMLDLYCSTWNNMKVDISGYSFTDEATKEAIRDIKNKYSYIIDPHGAVACLAAKEHLGSHQDHLVIALETAHPSKFIEEMESILVQKIEIPERLAQLENAKKEAVLMENDFQAFKSWLTS